LQKFLFKARPSWLVLSILLVLLCRVSSLPANRTLNGVVQKVADGDTVTLFTLEGTKLRVRLFGIDAPEVSHGRKPGQPFAEQAQQALEMKLLGKAVTLEVVEVDRHRRIVGILRSGSQNINRQMVQEGWAWAYRQYLKGPHASEFISTENEARLRRLGLWKQHNPQPPWEFRREIEAN
jgi:micrococcal nuclease